MWSDNSISAFSAGGYNKNNHSCNCPNCSENKSKQNLKQSSKDKALVSLFNEIYEGQIKGIYDNYTGRGK